MRVTWQHSDDRGASTWVPAWLPTFATACVLLSVVGCNDAVHELGVVASPSQPPIQSGDGDNGAVAPVGPTGDGDRTPGVSGHADAGPGGPTGLLDASVPSTTGGPQVPPWRPVEDELDDEGCLRSSAVRRHLDLYLLYDRLLSVPIPEPGDVIDEGLRQFLNDPRGQNTGVALLTLTNQCDASGYPAPDVDWGNLPEHARAIAAGIAPVSVNFTQAEPALDAAIAQASERGKQHPEWEQALVVLTDGFDFGWCPNANFTRTSTQRVVQQGADADPSVRTYVVALTSRSGPLTNLLDGISLPDLARSGGTGTAHMVEIEQGASAVADALNAIRVAAQPCHYEVPASMQSGQDEFGLALRQEPGLPQMASEADCGNDDGYFLGSVDATSYLMLCPATCDRVKQNTEWGHYAVYVRSCM